MSDLLPFPTFGATMGEVGDLLNDGWKVFHADRPEIAEIGFRAVREQEQRHLVWRPYGYLLHPDIQVTDNEDSFFAMFQQHITHRLFKCDRPEEDLLGFVCYCQSKQRRSSVFQLPSTLAPNLGAGFLEAREVVQDQNRRIVLVDA